MIHNIQARYKTFNLPEQVSTCILIFFKVSHVEPRIRKMRYFLKITPTNPHKQSLKSIYWSWKVGTLFNDFLAFAK